MPAQTAPLPASTIALLDSALATELVGALRCKQHHYAASSLGADKVAANFAEQAKQCMRHADAIATRIVQLGGQPDFCPDRLAIRSFTAYAERDSVGDMLRDNLATERARADSYRALLHQLGDTDFATSRLLEALLAAGQGRPQELAWLLDNPA
ncbi:ferritin-like domain-containing protein [Chitinimonas sp.]|uniref:ferritin-like domain-containing protein n=1 Tax=Chitinimonas sp. TaxID=1934313 RepID=UPI002F95A81D